MVVLAAAAAAGAPKDMLLFGASLPAAASLLRAPPKSGVAELPKTGEEIDSIFLGASWDPVAGADMPNRPPLGAGAAAVSLVDGLPKANVGAGTASFFFSSPLAVAPVSLVFESLAGFAPNVKPPTAGVAVAGAAAGEAVAAGVLDMPNLKPPIGVISLAGVLLLSEVAID